MKSMNCMMLSLFGLLLLLTMESDAAEFSGENRKNPGHDTLIKMDVDALLCDEKKRPGVLFSDLDLVGIPLRIVISKRNIQENQVEIKIRKNNKIILWDSDRVELFIEKFRTGEFD